MGIIAWLAGALASLLGSTVIRFVAWKLVLWTIVITVFPILLTNFVYKMIQTAMQVTANAQGQSNMGAAVLVFTGLAAWLATHLRLVDGFSLIMSSVMFRQAIRFIPFLGVR